MLHAAPFGTMRSHDLALQLAGLAPDAAADFLHEQASLPGSEVGWALKALFDSRESSDPDGAIAAASALALLAERTGDPQCLALSAWTRGMADQLEGNLPASLESLRLAEDRFLGLGQPEYAAATSISRLISLAMLGQYDEALRTGLRARAVFLGHHDLLAVGKVEQNLGNIYFRRDEYRKAEQLYRTARRRFSAVNDAKQLAQIDNCLGSALTWQHKFAAARHCYQVALDGAAAEGLRVTQAEIESNLGGLMLFQGRYDRALDYLERAHRRYVELGLAHEATISEKELAEAYLELNLIPEAMALLQRLLPAFAALGLQADLAASFTTFARACLGSGRLDEASAALRTARTLYQEEQNTLGVAHTLLVEAQWLNARHEHHQAAAVAAECARAFAHGQAWEWLLRASLQRGEALRALGASGEAEALFAGALAEAEQRELPQIVLHCLSALGALAFSQGEFGPAEGYLRRALSIFELLRATLPSEEFRISFRSDKTHLFAGLIALALQAARKEDALQLIERARSHTLLELVDGSIDATVQPRDAYEAGLVQQLAGLRSELNWFYHQLHRLPGAVEQLSDAASERLRQAARNHEEAIAAVLRRLQQRSDGESMQPAGHNQLPLAQLQQMLGPETAVIEYYALHGRVLAFVITNEAIHCAGDLLPESEAEQLVRRFRFQIDALRSGGGRLSRHMAQLTERCVAHLRRLYAALLQPLLGVVGERRLVIVPCGALHYLPFQALAAQDQHLVERTEVCVAPSAGLLYRCLQQVRRPVQRALLAGVPDEHTPHLAHEIEHLQALFPSAAAYAGEAATLGAVREQAPASDVLHLACHGYSRPDNPMFSALRLGDGWFTARDAYDLRLNCTLVTLSACETGINAVTPGEELLGLVRGFMAAGAPSLLVSLWPVDDETTTHFMRAFYTAWLGGAGLAQALRAAQRSLLAQNPHPYYWSPFVLYGRWD